VLTFEQIKELIELVGERRLQGLELERSGFRLKIDGQTAAPVAASPAPAAEAPGESARPQASGSAPSASPAPSSAPAAEAPADEPEIPDGAHVVESPIVGTFYRRPSPDQDPFVEVGDRVKKGQTLCIVEAMKLMNEIESDVDGVILEVFPQNAQPVEFEEPLFSIRAD